MTVYITLSYTGTLMARIVRLFTLKKYSHVCYSADDSFTSLHSFGRYYAETMFPAGYICSAFDDAFYAQHQDAALAVLAIEVTAEQKALIDERLAPFAANPKYYKYGVWNVPLQFFNIKHDRKHFYTCTQFIAYLFRGILPFQTDFSLVRPMDYLDFGCPIVYEGTIGDFLEKGKLHERN